MEIGAVKGGPHPKRVAQSEALDDIGLHPQGGGGGKGGDRRFGKPIDQLRQMEIIGTEIMPPFRDAVGFVDGGQVELSLP